MIKLNPQVFARAIEKAQSLCPACQCVLTDETNFTFYVERSAKTGAFAIVDIWHRGGVLWSSCDCPAGSDARWPLPCYHVAAAALALGLMPVALPVSAVLNPKPEGAAAAQVPASLLEPAELAPLTLPVGPASAPVEASYSVIGYLRSSAARALRGVTLWFSARSARA